MIVLQCSVSFAEVRVKDIARVQGVRENELFGYGLVVGLNGTGDNPRTLFTIQSVANMLTRMGITVSKERVDLKNVAAVIATAKLPAFAKAGNTMDVIVSSLGDAKSLQGGTLLLTPLQAGDAKVYAVAQGPVSIGGFMVEAASTGEKIQKNHPTVGRIPNGATIEKDIPAVINDNLQMSLILLNPDFTTSVRLAEAINKSFKGEFSKPADAGLVKIRIPQEYTGKLVEFISIIENIKIEADYPARIVINERTGTIIIGSNVRVSTVAISHGGLSIQIKSEFQVSQPEPFSLGKTEVVPKTETTVKEEKGNIILMPEGVSIGDVVNALNAIGVTPRDLIAIIQAIKKAGALQADLEIM